MIAPVMLQRGFLPEHDPLAVFPPGSAVRARLTPWAETCPACCMTKGSAPGSRLEILPPLPASGVPLAELRLYYVRVGFLASAYVNQVGQEPATVLPRNIALPLCDVCAGSAAADPQL